MSFFRSIGGKMIGALVVLLVIATIPIAIISRSATQTYVRMDGLIADNLPLLSASADAAKTAQRVATNVETVLRADLPRPDRRTAIQFDLGILQRRLAELGATRAATDDGRVQKALAVLRLGVGTFATSVDAALAVHDEVVGYNFVYDGASTSALARAYAVRTSYQRLFQKLEDAVQYAARFDSDEDVSKSDVVQWLSAHHAPDEKLDALMQKLGAFNERTYRAIKQILGAPPDERAALYHKHHGTLFLRTVDVLDQIIAYLRPTAAALQSREEAAVGDMERATSVVLQEVGAVEAAAQVLFAEQRNKVAADQSVADQRGLFVTGFAVLAGIGLSIAVSLHLSAPLGRLVRDMRRLAEGDTNIALADARRADEIGDIGRAVAVFRDTSLDREVLQRAAEMEKERQQMLEEKARRDEERMEEARLLEQAIEALGRGLHHLAEGKLFYRIGETLAPNVETLRLDFNSAMERVQRALAEVGACAVDIQAGSGEISGVADDLSHRVEQQASSLQQTASALDQITNAVGKTAEGAGHARAVVATAKKGAEAAGTVVEQAIDAINRIETSSQKIGHIIGVIDEIAFQTNLLALNAGVEAARAGEAGRGFAVVALEVRALAQRSADAAREIKTLISDSKAEVDQGVERVTDTGRSLRAIVEQVAEINVAVATIAENANLQSKQLREINGAVTNMDQVTQRNTLIVQRATATSHALGAQTGRLQKLMASFELGKASLADAVRRRDPSESAAARPVPPRPAPHVAPPVAGDAGLRSRAMAANASWDEF